jgi:hypothetical protein
MEECPMGKYFPWHIVGHSQGNPELQSYHGVKEEYLDEANSCPKCGTPPERLRWVYVRQDPDPSERPWDRSCREGYLLICEQCMLQVDFFCERRV